jgi:branched-chain amino acid aminotransferase
VSTWVFLNEQWIPEANAVLHFRDLSVQRGYGVFDFFKVADGMPVFLNDHLDRFYFSAEQMHLPIRYPKGELKKIVTELLEKNSAGNTGVRMTLTGGYSADNYQLSKPNLIIACNNFTSPGIEQFETGIKLITYPHQRQLPHVKSIDYLMGIWLQPLIKENNADDVLYHQNGIVTECPRSNFFIVTKDDRIITPSENILKGVVRNHLISIAKETFIVEEKDITLDEIETAKEAFITSTTKTILPVREINKHVFTGFNNISKELYQRLIQLQSDSFQTV